MSKEYSQEPLTFQFSIISVEVEGKKKSSKCKGSKCRHFIDEEGNKIMKKNLN